jgi:hypothetical protein
MHGQFADHPLDRSSLSSVPSVSSDRQDRVNPRAALPALYRASLIQFSILFTPSLASVVAWSALT